jgi:hypothetical protein
VNHERNVAGHADLIEEGIEILPVLDESVTIGSRVRQLVALAHPDQIGRKAAPLGHEVRHHVAPEHRRRRVSVKEYDRVAFAFFHVGHLVAKDFHKLSFHGNEVNPLRSAGQ